MVRSFLDTWNSEKDKIKSFPKESGLIAIVTGELAGAF